MPPHTTVFGLWLVLLVIDSSLATAADSMAVPPQHGIFATPPTRLPLPNQASNQPVGLLAIAVTTKQPADLMDMNVVALNQPYPTSRIQGLVPPEFAAFPCALKPMHLQLSCSSNSDRLSL